MHKNDWIKNYPKKQRKNITELAVTNAWWTSSEEKLTGLLKIEGFINLREFNCGGNLLTNLEISNCPRLENLECYGNQLTSVELKDLPKLATIDCSSNQLNNISIINCPELGNISVSNNLLNNLDFLNSLDPKKVIFLNLACNNVVEQDLSVFGRFTDLKDLWIGNWDEEKISQGIYNRFFGSLEPLKNFTKLEQLNISNTDISEGLEYLPVSLKSIDCDTDKRGSQAKVRQIHDLLKPFGKWYFPPSNFLGRLITKYDYYDYQEWRKVNYEKVKIVQLEKELEEMRKQLSSLQVQIQQPPK